MKKLIAEELGVEEEKIYGMDLFLYNRMEPSVWGREKEFLSCPQLDDLQCAFASLNGFLAGENAKISMYLPALTMKRLDQEPSREQHRHCCRMCFVGSTRHWEKMRKISIVQLPEVLC